ncbi:MAG: SDR family oxidoreductase [Bacteroidaceae bacterium]|nr:SDR family oxidoreductase [Bacteroidaceae bacterium]
MGKVVVITGASSGFGKATAELLASQGHTVYGLSRRKTEHGQITFMQCDVRDFETVKRVIDSIAAKEGHIDVLVNNAGMGIGGALELATSDEIAVQMGTNFEGCANLCRATLPYMRRLRQGKIINISSIGGLMGLPYQGYYSASKFAIEGFSEALYAEVKRFGISVSLVEPGDFATNFTASRKNSQATIDDPDYGPVFKGSLDIIENEENGGLKPDRLALVIARIVDARNPRMHYVVANLEQRLSVLLKRILPGGAFARILCSYYKS